MFNCTLSCLKGFVHRLFCKLLPVLFVKKTGAKIFKTFTSSELSVFVNNFNIPFKQKWGVDLKKNYDSQLL